MASEEPKASTDWIVVLHPEWTGSAEIARENSH